MLESFLVILRFFYSYVDKLSNGEQFILKSRVLVA